jgi:uncharacterized membrane protein YeaQ/YmgE (transglycosylase-associated protein family)
MDGVSLIAWIVVGAIAGWLASIVMKSPMGLLTDIIVGIIGGFIGGWLLNLLGVGGGAARHFASDPPNHLILYWTSMMRRPVS